MALAGGDVAPTIVPAGSLEAHLGADIRFTPTATPILLSDDIRLLFKNLQPCVRYLLTSYYRQYYLTAMRYIVIDTRTAEQIGRSYTTRTTARRAADRLDLAFGAIRYQVRVMPLDRPWSHIRPLSSDSPER